MEPQHKGGKGKPKNATGKGASSLEKGEQTAVSELQPKPALASSPGLASIETPVKSPHLDHKGCLRWTCDTSAAISAFPLDAQIGTETQADDCSNKTASSELISDRGGLRVQSTTECRYGVSFQGRKADVHKTLIISASKVLSQKGPRCSCVLERRLFHPLQQHTCEKDSKTRSNGDCQRT